MGILFFQISSKSTNDRNESEGGIATFGMKTMGRRKGNAICIMATGLGGRDWQYNVFLSMALQMDVAGGPKESFMEAKALIKHDNNNNVILSVLDDYTFDIHKQLLKCILPFNPISYSTDNNEESAFETTLG